MIFDPSLNNHVATLKDIVEFIQLHCKKNPVVFYSITVKMQQSCQLFTVSCYLQLFTVKLQ